MKYTISPHPAWLLACAEWSVQDSEDAAKQGWNIYASAPNPLPGDDDPPFVIWRDDEAMILHSDEDAYELLRRLVDANDSLAVKARMFLERHSPEEFQRVFHSDGAPSSSRHTDS